MNLKNPWRKALGAATAALALAFSMLLPATSAHAAPAAGTVIGNQASATYTDGSGTSRTTTSNLVQTTVSQVKSFTLTANGNQTATPGQTVYFPHTINNTGNGTDSYNLNAATGAPGTPGFTPTGMVYYADANGDGVPDNATPITTSTPVPAGGQFRFVVAAVVPGGAALGAIGNVTVNVSDTVTSLSNTDQITVAASAVSVTKSLDITSGPSPSTSAVTVTLRYTNSGTAAASALEITDVLPSGMTYVAGSALWSGSSLTDTAGGDPAGISYSAVTTGGVTTIIATIASVPAGGSGDVKFKVNIASGLAPTNGGNQSVTTNVATYKTSTQTTTMSTNNALYTVLQTASVALSASSTVPGDTSTATVALAAQGSVVSFPIYAFNTGNGTDTLNISYANIGTFPAGTTFQIFRGDGTTPLIDTNGDGIVDTGPLAPSTTVPMALVVKATLPASGTPGAGPFSATFTATSVFSSAATDTVLVSLTAITPSAVDVTIDAAFGQGGALGTGTGSGTAVKTDSVTPLQSASSTWLFRMYVNNRGTAADAYNLSLQSAMPAGWGVTFYANTAGSCATLGSSISSTGSIAGQGSLLVCAVVTVPSIQSGFAAPGSRTFELLARSASNPTQSNDYAAVAIDLATVNSVSLSPNGIQQTYAGAPVTYTHSVANLGNTAQTVTFTAGFLTDAQVAAGWTSSAYIDSNNNGVFEPGTDPLVSTTSSIPLAVGASKTIFVRVFAPGSATSASPADVTTLTATYTGGTTSATDTTGITDGLLLLKEQVATACGGGAPAGPYSSNPIAAGAATAPGQCIGYKITATNTTAQTISNVVLSDTVPANTTLNTGCGSPAASGGATIGGTATTTGSTGTVTATAATLGANASFTATFCVQINP
ncbi:beta strand repeat-containing protein [Ramlibacter sp. AN1133]|uniref:beta strand repeat-containing protein n=1 Tax=Ramlibacter sp. AN1133 TaxID=3133429 RepID=UPI0030BF4555